jgi:hypothetical protein
MALFLHLFHGRSHPDDQPEDWGTVGPTFGPIKSLSGTYGDPPHFVFENFKEGYLSAIEDLIHYDDTYYGDWCVTTDGPETDTFSQHLATPPGMPVPPHPDEGDECGCLAPEPPITAIVPAPEAPTLTEVDKAMIDALIHLRDIAAQDDQTNALAERITQVMQERLGLFDPKAGFDSVEQAYYLIQATADPIASLAAVVAENIRHQEFGFCTGLLMEW